MRVNCILITFTLHVALFFFEQCSATCGAGEQYRRVVCQAVTKEGWILPGEVPYGCKQSEKPTATQTCNYGPCNARYRWMTGMWGEVRTTVKKNITRASDHVVMYIPSTIPPKLM